MSLQSFDFLIILTFSLNKLKNIIFVQSFVAHQEQDWKIMQLINNKIRDDIVKKYAQYTKRVNGEMIKGKKINQNILFIIYFNKI